MAQAGDWMPRKREEQLKMAMNWNVAIKSKGKSMWRMDAETVAEFEEAVMSAETENARLPEKRNAGTNVLLKEAFDKLTKMMRDIKRRYLLNPPVSNADLANLGIKQKDTSPTPIAAPSKPAIGDLYFPAVGLVEIRKIRAVGAKASDRADYGVRIYCGILCAEDQKSKYRITERPKTGDDLVHSEFTRRKTHRFDFPNERGKEVFFCLRYENSKGQTGLWGKIISAFIP
jgi:hypothetical protein